LADKPQLLPMSIICERLDHIRAGSQKIAVQSDDRLGMIQDGLRNKGSGLHVPAPLELEQVTFRADDGSLIQALQQTRSGFLIGHMFLIPRDKGCSRRGADRPRQSVNIETDVTPRSFPPTKPAPLLCPH